MPRIRFPEQVTPTTSQAHVDLILRLLRNSTTSNSLTTKDQLLAAGPIVITINVHHNTPGEVINDILAFIATEPNSNQGPLVHNRWVAFQDGKDKSWWKNWWKEHQLPDEASSCDTFPVTLTKRLGLFKCRLIMLALPMNNVIRDNTERDKEKVPEPKGRGERSWHAFGTAIIPRATVGKVLLIFDPQPDPVVPDGRLRDVLRGKQREWVKKLQKEMSIQQVWYNVGVRGGHMACVANTLEWLRRMRTHGDGVWLGPTDPRATGFERIHNLT
jgi:hypothetical protein